jgi:hypothetical protein
MLLKHNKKHTLDLVSLNGEVMKKFTSVFWFIVEMIPWNWLMLAYFAYVLISKAPTPWHAQCVYFAVIACMVLSIDVKNYVHDGVRSFEKELGRVLRK